MCIRVLLVLSRVCCGSGPASIVRLVMQRRVLGV